MEEAIFLTRFASKVTIVNRSEKFRASMIVLDRAMAHPQIAFMTSTIVEEILGIEEKEVKGLRTKQTTTGEESVPPVSGMFLVVVTHKGQVIPGVFACGDIQDRRYRQAITAAGSGCMAALEAGRYLEEHGR